MRLFPASFLPWLLMTLAPTNFFSQRFGPGLFSLDLLCLNTYSPPKVRKPQPQHSNQVYSFMYKTRVLINNYKTVKKYNAVIAGWANYYFFDLFRRTKHTK